MLGAIIGDIIGSRFEFNNHRSKDFDLFTEECFVTDDSIMTLSIAKAIMEAYKIKKPSNRGYDNGFHARLSELTVKYMQKIGRKYPNCGFGSMFNKWIFSNDPKPYNSFGNGAAMRVSPAGFFAQSEWDAERLAETVTAVTHDHAEGIKGAAATAVAIHMAQKGALKSEIRERITRDYYPINFEIDDIRTTYHFNETCQETVPQAIECFLEATSFEDSIRTAISLGGDSDTIAAITGAIAEAYYGVPEDLRDKALVYLDVELRTIYDDWAVFNPPNVEQFKVLTKYIGRLSDRTMIDGYIVPFWDYFPCREFELEFYSEFTCSDYEKILSEMGVTLDYNQIIAKSVNDLNAKQVLALITSAFRNDHFDEGIIVKYFRSGAMLKWLKRLKEIDWQRSPRKITEVELELGGMGGYNNYRVLLTDETATFSLSVLNLSDSAMKVDEKNDTESVRSTLDGMHFEYWLPSYPQEDEMRICDGEQWNLKVTYDDGTIISSGGDNTYPENWNELLEFFGIDKDDNEDERQPGELIYCSVSFDGGKTYYYTTEDESIKVGDEVIVPIGTDNNELTGTVEDIEYFLPENAPFPFERTKAITDKAVEFEDDEGDGLKEFQMDEQQFLVIKDSSNIDILDENLYSFGSTVFAFTPAIQNRTSDSLLRKVRQFIDSVPAAQKARDLVQNKTVCIPRLDLITKEIEQAMQNGTAEIIPCKYSTDAFFLQIRSTVEGLMINGKIYGKNRKIKDIPLSAKSIPTDIAGALQCLSMQNQLNQIANGLKEISEACEFNFGRIIQGQRDDRLAKLLSSRSCFIQALAMSDETLQRQMLMQAVCDANSARAELAFQIKSDISLLGGDKTPNAKDMEKMVCDINTAIVAMNNAVQISLYSYQVLGERNAQIAVVKEHETFIKQMLLKEIEYKGKRHLAWKIICSSGNSGLTPQDFQSLPTKLLVNCAAFIENKNEKSTNYLEGKSND